MATVKVIGHTEIVGSDATTQTALVTAAGTDTNTFEMPAQANAVNILISADAAATDSTWVLIGSVDGSTWHKVASWNYADTTTFQTTSGNYELDVMVIPLNSVALSQVRYFALGFTAGADTYTCYATPARI